MMNRIWWREDIPMTEKFVALALADRADDEGICWPAVETIAIKCSCTTRTVQNAVKALCAKGFLRKLERTNNSSYYLFNLEVMPVMEQPKRKKEKHPLADKITGESHDIDLFSTGESHDMTGESHDVDGCRRFTRDVRETLEETTSRLSGDLASPAVSESMSPDAKTISYVEHCWEHLKNDHPMVAMPRKIDEGLAKMIVQRAAAHAKDGETGVDVWHAVFVEIRASQFLCGRTAPGPGRDKSFTLSLGWLCRPGNFREVINGKYTSKSVDSAYGADGKRLGPTGQAVAGTLARLRAAQERGGGGRDPRSAGAGRG